MPHDPNQLRDFARRYTEAWCSQEPTRVAAHYAADGRIAVNGAASAPILEVAASFMTASAPSGGQIGASLAGGAKAAIPIAPAPDLLIGTTSARSASGGDAWPTNVSFLSALPVVPPGRYTATVTFTVIGR